MNFIEVSWGASSLILCSFLASISRALHHDLPCTHASQNKNDVSNISESVNTVNGEKHSK